jgi:phage-related protein
MALNRKPLGWLVDSLATPPVGTEARREAGTLLRLLQQGETLSLPESRPMPDVGRRVHELRVKDRESRSTWRIFYRIDRDAILVIEWFAKKTEKTPRSVIDTCKARLKRYDLAAKKGSER